MQKSTLTRITNYLKILLAFLVFSIGIFNKVVAQRKPLLNIISDLKKVKVNAYSTRIIPIDSILNNSGHIYSSVQNEFKELNNISDTKSYLIRIGYYQADSMNVLRNQKAFTSIKRNLKQINPRKIAIIDFNCQDSLSLNEEVVNYRNSIGSKSQNYFFISLYKTTHRIKRNPHKKVCYVN